MKVCSIVVGLSLFLCLLTSNASQPSDAFTFPVREEMTLSIAGSNYDIRLHDLPGKGATGFAWSVMRNGYLIKIEIIDGIAPSIISAPTSHKNQFGILYKVGAHQSVLDLVSLAKNGFDNMNSGRISSNLACIYGGEADTVFSVSESNGKLFIDRFRVGETTIKSFPTVQVPSPDVAKTIKQCPAKSFFGKELQ